MCECPTLYREEKVRARKQHWCCECGTAIAPGETYERASGLWDGSFGSHSTCAGCAEVRNEATAAASRLDCCELPAFGELYEWVSEVMRYEPSPALVAFGVRLEATREHHRAKRAARAASERGPVL